MYLFHCTGSTLLSTTEIPLMQQNTTIDNLDTV